MPDKIRLMILECHQSVIDGYVFRLSNVPDIEIVATINYGDQLLPALAAHPTNLLILDFNISVSEIEPHSFPIFPLISTLKLTYPHLAIVIITMFKEAILLKLAVENGVSGYIFKDERAQIQRLGSILRSLAAGGTFLSEQANELYLSTLNAEPLLTMRQIEILSLSIAYPDITTESIAKKLNLAHSTVRNTLSQAYKKLGVTNHTAAITKAREMGLVSPFIQPPLT